MANGRRLGLYERRIFPWLNDKLSSDPDLIRIRTEAVAAVHGRVIEIGFGSGSNISHYPNGVESVVGVEPNEGMLDRAFARIRVSDFPVQIIVAEAEQLPLRDQTFDTAVSTLTLCSVADPAKSLMELHRVLRDDGRLVILEHGLSDDAGIARWQNWLNPLQKIVACGCHLNRPIVELVQRYGFRFDVLRRFYAPKVPRTHGWVSVGTAVKS